MLESLRGIVQEVTSTKDFEVVLDIIVRRVKEVMSASICSVYLYDQDDDSYVLMATEGLNPGAVGKVRLKPGEGLVGMVATRAEPVNLDDAESHPNFVYFPETGEKLFNAFLGSPIIHHRKVLGVLIVQESERRFDESEEAFLVTVSAQLAGVIAHAEAVGDLSRLLSPDIKEIATDFEQIYLGLPSAPGIATGRAVVISPPASLQGVPRRTSTDTVGELQSFRKALKETKQDMRALNDSMAGKLSDEERELFDVYIRMLDDRALGGEVIDGIKGGLTAQSAWSEVILDHVRQFESMEDAYFRERAADVRDLGRRVLSRLQQSEKRRVDYSEDVILVGEELTATAFAEVPIEIVKGIVSVQGSRNSHMAILGRAMGIPTIMGTLDLPWSDMDSRELVVDGYQGQVVVNPEPATRNSYNELVESEKLLAADLEVLRDEPCTTEDQCRMSLWVNTGLRIDTMMSIDRGAEGVGLYRTEIPFLMRDRFPSESEQVKEYREQLEMFHPRTVTMRTLDIGGDKALPYFPIEEDNPFLGWRGIRITLDHPEIFLAQIRAMMRASEGLDNLSILLPMISNVAELDASLELVHRAYSELTEEEGFQLKMPKLGVMIEVPAAVYQVRDLARRVDFLSVGTNDLTQYLLAVDRNNPRVAELYHTYHPALLQALKAIVAGAEAENVPVSVCGEMAGDPVGAVLLMALGYRVLSMSSASLLKVKAMLRQISLSEAEALLGEVLTLQDSAAVRSYLEEALDRPGLAELFRSKSLH